MSNSPGIVSESDELIERAKIAAAQAVVDGLLAEVTEQITFDRFNPQDDELLKRLVEGFADKRGMARLAIAQTLGEIGQPATPYLIEAVASHANPVVRRASAKALTLIADPSAVPTLVYALLHDKDTVVRSSVVGALAGTGEAAVPALLSILESEEYCESAKGHAAWALSFIGAAAAEYLYPALNSPSIEVRCAVIGAFANVALETGDAQACEVLVTALSDREVSIRNEAASGLGKVNYPAAIPALLLALDDAEMDVRKAAVASLGKTAGESAIERLAAVQTTDEAEVVRALAKIAIAQIEHRQGASDWG